LARSKMSVNIRTPREEEEQTQAEARRSRIQRIYDQADTEGRTVPFAILPDQYDVIVQAIAVGNFYSTACKLAGVSVKTFYDWLAKGGDPESTDQKKDYDPREPYKSFAEDVRQAEAYGEAELVADMKEFGRGDWKSRAYILARKYPERWAEKTQTATIGPGASVQIFLPENNRDRDTIIEAEGVVNE
jgi:hypothetical protein